MMEVKKSQMADLERKRPAWFLLGMAVAIASFIVALEFSVNGNSMLLDSDFLDEIAEDMEFIPPMQKAVPVEEEVAKLSDQLEVVEEIYENEKVENEEKVPQAELLTEKEVLEENVEDKVESVVIDDNKEEDVTKPRDLDDLPVFPGGMSQLVRWLTQNLKYPESAKNEKVAGKVIVSFVVNTNGTVSDVKLVKSVDQRLDREAVRVVKMMPEWQPGLMKGKPCKTLVNLPVVFKL